MTEAGGLWEKVVMVVETDPASHSIYLSKAFRALFGLIKLFLQIDGLSCFGFLILTLLEGNA
jgi:hypothetical protein